MSQGTPMNCDEARDLAAVALLGPVSEAERTALDAHLASCSACTLALAGMREAVGALAYAAPPRAVRPEAKVRLLARVAEPARRPAEPVARPSAPAPVAVRPWMERVLVACSVVLAVGLGGSVVRIGQLQAQLAAMNTATSELRAQLAREHAQTASLAEEAAFLATRDVRMVPMQPQPMASGAQAWVYWSPEHHAWLVTFRGLPATGPSKTYQLWAVTPDKKISLGTFSADANGVARVQAQLPAGGKPVAAAVTVEPDGGMPQPTGPMVMVGPIKQL